MSHHHHHKRRRDWRGAALGLALTVAMLAGLTYYSELHRPKLVIVTELVPQDQIPHNGPEPVEPVPAKPAHKPHVAPHVQFHNGLRHVHPHHRHHRTHHHHWMIRPRQPAAPVCVEPFLCN